MKSKEFFNILDDMDEHLVSEIFEDVQRPQKITAMPRSPKRLPKILLGSAACLAVIAAAGLAVRFAAPGVFTALSGTSENSGNWFSQKHIHPLRRTNVSETSNKTFEFRAEENFLTLDVYEDWSPEDYEIIASDNGTVIFAGKISEAYGSGVIIKYTENAYIAYGGLDPDTVTVSAGDKVTTGNILAHPKPFRCLYMGTIVQIKTSRQPITKEFFQSECELDCRSMSTWKNTINTEKHGSPDSDGMHHITANTEDEVKAVESGIVIYTGTDSDGSGMVVVLDQSENNVFIVYKGLDTTFPDFYVKTEVKMPVPDFYVEKYHKMAVAGETIGYVGDSGDAYWFVLDHLEFEKFAEENGINFYPMHN